ncbi:hypothetical protein Nocox_07145 [Nonomuraea coxensis DSM 45129]|uniref:Uncharacterized protein n=1 Tax=Nonomuraea coxensis DSM 45129 TaxID=1122611 RepID=A0ABX8TUA0_9ACTN|nr:hypothetical protein Nocox_07145 [Nonomuraea coxensis DSM 45129]
MPTADTSCRFRGSLIVMLVIGAEKVSGIVARLLTGETTEVPFDRSVGISFGRLGRQAGQNHAGYVEDALEDIVKGGDRIP